MKTFVKTLALFLMLCCALQLSTSADNMAITSVNSICCFNETNVRIPLKRLESYFWTSSRCPLKHIVFVTSLDTKKQKKKEIQKKLICMDPDYENKWVRRAINYLNKTRD